MEAYRVYNKEENVWGGPMVYDVVKDEHRGKIWYSKKLAENAAKRKNDSWRNIKSNLGSDYEDTYRGHSHNGLWEVAEYNLVRKG